jgi:hypothetical protein
VLSSCPQIATCLALFWLRVGGGRLVSGPSFSSTASNEDYRWVVYVASIGSAGSRWPSGSSVS